MYYHSGFKAAALKQIRTKVGIRKVFKEFADQRNPIQLAILMQDWSDAYNVGGMFRVADACGVSELIMTGKTPVVGDSPQIAVTSMGAHRRMPWRHFDRHDDACAALKAEGYSLVAIEVAEGACHYMHYEYPSKCCLVLGNEGAGVYGNVMKQCDGAVFIPMAGKGRSMNVHVAGAIVAFEAILRTPEP
ncbi:MAG: tRNA methyltransferase [Armatimonadetes bacterium]|nr:tRNA methyltransferase [Armatimonadota bacterium]